ncbi:MAG TPA: hypothetical protein DHW71_07070 [Gammaproteobacteria bacterium]|nr:hypothetical protein [Gammaproteobacteria bacterium]|tara:strand:- start:3427 stop:5256 length:1830 start_codon:yes stop_codon:yes gene_type:complete
MAQSVTISSNFIQNTQTEASYLAEKSTETAIRFNALKPAGATQKLNKFYGRCAFVNKNASDMRSPINVAISNGDLDEVKKLMRLGAIFNQVTIKDHTYLPTDIAITSRHRETLQFLLDLGQPLNPQSDIFKAAIKVKWTNEAELLSMQLLSNAVQNSHDADKIHRALEYKLDTSILKQLLTPTRINHVRQDGHSPLSLAFKLRDYAAIKTLLSYPAMPYNRDYAHNKSVLDIVHETILDPNYASDLYQMVDILVTIGKQKLIDKKNYIELIHIADLFNDIKLPKALIHTLMAKGVSLSEIINTPSKNGRSFYSSAIRYHEVEKLALYTHAGANSNQQQLLREAIQGKDLDIYMAAKDALKLRVLAPIQTNTQLINAHYVQQPLPFKDIANPVNLQKIESELEVSIKPLISTDISKEPFAYIFSNKQGSKADLALISAHGMETGKIERNRGCSRLNFVAPAHHTLMGYILDYVSDVEKNTDLKQECDKRTGTNAQFKPGEDYPGIALAPAKSTEYDIKRACQIIIFQKVMNMKPFDFIVLDPQNPLFKSCDINFKVIQHSINKVTKSYPYKDLLIYTCRTSEDPRYINNDQYYAVDPKNPAIKDDKRFNK